MRKLILITNDDGVQAKGINTLIQLAKPFGDVVVVAPEGPRSGQSNAITMMQPIYRTLLHQEEGLTVYSCSGTPTDCVKIALHDVLERKPDLLLSGINHGSNASINVIYSGTMGAVLEGCSQGIQSIGFSLCNHSANADFTHTEPFFRTIIEQLCNNPLPYGVCLNVNAPQGTIKGTKVCSQAQGMWHEEFDARVNPFGKPYYWMTGEFKNIEPDNHNSDEWALSNGYISIVPTTCDTTHHSTIALLKEQGYEQD